ncbi:MAG: C1 family peptidase [Candidatus Omnitrophica bacterium]|nr:C1 family peptidase [Candidatus Omnitrophota bacterium]
MIQKRSSSLKPTTFGYGWIPDIPDTRDLYYSAIRPKLKFPPSVDLRSTCSAVENQGQLGSCTANALAGNLEFLDKKNDGIYTDVSRLFIYFNERVLDGHEDSDSGASLRNGVKTLVKIGVCLEKSWPYQISKFSDKPTTVCYNEAKKHRIVSYHRILSINEMFDCLSQGFPFVFGFTVYESFESPLMAKTGKAQMPNKGERALGGHAVLAVGYNQKDKRFLVRNSWGEGWGLGGYFTMPFEYVETLANDFWTIRK